MSPGGTGILSHQHRFPARKDRRPYRDVLSEDDLQAIVDDRGEELLERPGIPPNARD